MELDQPNQIDRQQEKVQTDDGWQPLERAIADKRDIAEDRRDAQEVHVPHGKGRQDQDRGEVAGALTELVEHSQSAPRKVADGNNHG